MQSVEILEHLMCVPDELFALFGQLHTAGIAFEEPASQLLFKLGNLL